MITAIWILIFLGTASALSYQRAKLIIWTVTFLILLALHTHFSHANHFDIAIEWVILAALAIFLNIRILRRTLFTKHVIPIFRRLMPPMSRTEREALEAGTVGWESELFKGAPNWKALLAMPAAKLTAEEQAFLDGPVEELCRLTDDWDITHNRADLPPAIWKFLKDQGFFGLIIPKQYGGKEFSASAHSAILIKLYSRSVSLASTVSVPNSLGPAELLLHYGTAEQKNYYLPRLATGEEIPCFALTGPDAGSDASSIPDYGVVCHGEFDGKSMLGIRLTWDKRYITLAPVATVVGLAFKLHDPDHLIGTEEDVGITCALIPAHTPGVHIGRRHFPSGAVFQNGPTHGRDVFIPLDWIIGGTAMAGQGWNMLMECLSAGRAITLPSGAVSGAKMATFATGAYARIRKQFNLAIGHFEGIQTVLASMGAGTYLIDSALKATLAAIDNGDKPAVLSAIMKYHATEYSRKIVNDAMDVHGGKGICLGPHNYLGNSYQSAPIGITVEGANILTRCLIIFGQGAIRCHPFILTEMRAANDNNPQRGLKTFDKAFFGHMAFSISNVIRAFVLGLTASKFVFTPSSPTRRYFQQLTRYSAAFALIADTSMLLLGGDLKRKENLSARLGDILSMLYLASAMLKRYAEDDYPINDRPVIDWLCHSLFFTIEQCFDGLLRNLPQRWASYLLRFIIFPYGKWQTEPSDKLGRKIAELLIEPTPTRDRITQGIYIGTTTNNTMRQLEDALLKVIAAEPLEKRLHIALRKGHIGGYTLQEQITSAITAGELTDAEAVLVLEADVARHAIIAVDDFAADELARKKARK